MRQRDPKRQLQQSCLSTVTHNNVLHYPEIEPRSATWQPTALTTVPLITLGNLAKQNWYLQYCDRQTNRKVCSWCHDKTACLEIFVEYGGFYWQIRRTKDFSPKIQGKVECCGTVNVKFIKISPRNSIRAAGHFQCQYHVLLFHLLYWERNVSAHCVFTILQYTRENLARSCLGAYS